MLGHACFPCWTKLPKPTVVPASELPPPPGTHPSSPQGPEVPHLDPADSLLSLHHSDVFGGVSLREQLGGAQVVGCKDDPIDEVFWLTGPWN